MARTNMQGFESRGIDTIGVFVGGGAASVTITSPGYLGIGYQLSVVSGSGGSTDARGTYILPSHVQAAELYIRMMLSIDNNGVNPSSNVRIHADVGDVIVEFIPGTGDINIIGVTQGNIGVRTTNYERWEFYIKIDDSSGVVTFKIDGTEVFTYSGDTKPGAATAIATMAWYVASSLTRSIHVDDIAVNDIVDDGRSNDTWPGSGKIYGFRPNIQGPFRAWDKFPDAGEENWEDVDDAVPDDDTTYVQSGSLGQRDAHGTENIPAGSFNIRSGCVQWEVSARLVGAGPGEIASYMVKDGVTKEGNSRAPDVTYNDTHYLYDMLPTDPDGNEWLRDDFDNTQFGYKAT